MVNVDDPYGRRLAEELDCGSGGDCITFSAAGGDADLSAREVTFDARGSRFLCLLAGGRARGRDAAARATSTSPTRSPRLRVAHALGARPARRPRAPSPRPSRSRAASSRSTRASRSRCSSTTRTRPTRSRTCCGAARRLTERPADLGLRRRRRPRPREAAADGPGRGGALRRRGGHLRQPALRGPGAIIAEILRRHSERARTPRSWSSRTGGRRSRWRLGRAGEGDTVVIAGKGHEQGQEFEGGRKIPFDDRDVAREELRKLARRAPRVDRARAVTVSPRRPGRRCWRAGRAGGPARAVIDSREVREGDLFFGLPGERFDGGEFAAAALEAAPGASWSRPSGAASSPCSATWRGGTAAGWVLGADDPLAALQSLARAWRRGARLPGGRDHRARPARPRSRTSAARCCPASVHASPRELQHRDRPAAAVLEAPAGTEVLVLEMAMRGPGQIAELCAIAEPDVGVITNVGPSTSSCSARSRRSPRPRPRSSTGCRPGGTAVVPAEAGALEPHLERAPEAAPLRRRRRRRGAPRCWPRRGRPMRSCRDARRRAALQASRSPRPTTSTTRWRRSRRASRSASRSTEMADRRPRIAFSRLRGELVELPEDAILINDCYNANPISMRAALDHLASLDGGGRRVAVLGEMGELGPGGRGLPPRDRRARARASGSS